MQNVARATGVGILWWMCAASGCAETVAAPRPDARLIERVQVSKAEPSPDCQALGAIEGRSADCDDPDNNVEAYQSAYDSLRAAAAVRGGNFVVIDSTGGPHLVSISPVVYDGRMSIRGRVFACNAGWPRSTAATSTAAPQPAAAIVSPAAASDSLPIIDHLWTEAAAAATPAPAPYTATAAPALACEPDCSPGYVCAHGTCVQACNPVCFAGQICGEDRICH